MFSFLLLNRSAWDDYFPGINPTRNIKQQEITTKPTISETSVFVSNCLFNRCSSITDGGALSCTSATYILIESSSFFTCMTSDRYGGAIYINNTDNGNCVLHGVCGNDCCSTNTSSGSSWGQFAFIRVKNDLSNKNYVYYSSISRCVNQTTISRYTFWLYSGKIYCSSVNSSMNRFLYHSGITCYPYPDSSSVTCLLSYSSITDNIACGVSCICLHQSGAKHEIKCCNILRNMQGTPNSEGTIRSYGYMMIEDSCILENNATYTFYVLSSSTITISNCTVDNKTSYGNFTIQNTAMKSFIHGLNHIYTRNCHSEYDSVGTITAVPYVSVKKIFCYTCERPRYNLFSLNYVFMVTFIHSFPFR
jgi:hypothetical protein